MIATRQAATLLLSALAVETTVHGFTVTQPPMPIKFPLVGTLPDFLIRGGVDRLQEIYEVRDALKIGCCFYYALCRYYAQKIYG